MFKSHTGKLIAAILLVCAISLTGCPVKKQGIDAPSTLIDRPEDTIETVDVTGPDEATRDTLSPEEQRRIEEEELARKESAARADIELAKQTIIQDIYFEFDRYDLSPSARDTLSGIADWLGKNSSAKIRIEGHADERGTSEYNLALGDRRANTAKKYLVALGTEENRLSTISYGEEMPQDEGQNEQAWAKNRRVHFEIK